MPSSRGRVLWAPKATQDLGEIWRYYARVASTDIADKLLREIAEAVQRASDRPLASRSRDEIMPGFRSILVHPLQRVLSSEQRRC
jgi:plasmid stabilization system protein ParE